MGGARGGAGGGAKCSLASAVSVCNGDHSVAAPSSATLPQAVSSSTAKPAVSRRQCRLQLLSERSSTCNESTSLLIFTTSALQKDLPFEPKAVKRVEL